MSEAIGMIETKGYTGSVESTDAMAKAANMAHQKAYGADPGAFYLNAYAAALALINAIEKSCATDYDAIIDALRTEWVATPLGIIKFDSRGDAIGVGFAMYQVQSGQYVTVEF